MKRGGLGLKDLNRKDLSFSEGFSFSESLSSKDKGFNNLFKGGGGSSAYTNYNIYRI